MKQTLRILLIVMLAIAMGACSSRKVTRVSPDETIDLSGRWNSTDAQSTAEAMITQSLSERWISDFQNQNDNLKPVVIVGFVQNKTHEHIDAEIFINDLEKAFINSGRVKLVQGGEKREQLRGERAAQQDYSSPETVAQWGREVGANFMLQGDITSIVDTYKKEKVIFYKVNLQLTNIETSEVVWIGDKEIKKYVNK
ncbi:MAG: penicillin-binding protein activator LpoB [Bacteroidetes bacterium 4484_276]|nr:MAG: penicillin-binding protein activator LpoB [Bacteroidetes bacterium 4484_276]